MSVTEDQPFILEDLPLFGLMPPDVRRLVAASFEPVNYPFGAVIVEEGEPADALYVIVSGRARALRQGLGGEEVSLGVLGPGDVFGETALLEGRVRGATIRARGPVEALRLPAVVFKALSATDPRVTEYFDLLARFRALRNLFRQSPVFSTLPDDTVGAVLAEMEPVAVTRGQVIVNEGDEPDAMYFVEAGRLAAYSDAGGERRDFSYLRTGDIFGERALLERTRRTASVRAVSDAHLLVLRQDAFDRLLATHGGFRTAVAALLSQYRYRTAARVPLDFTDEILPADAGRAGPVGPEQVDAAPAGAVPGPAVDDGAEALEPGGRRRRIRRLRQVWQVDEADCGAAALVMVCRHFGRRVSQARVRQAVGTGIDGTSLKGITDGARALGLSARAVKSSMRNLDDLPLPAVVHWGGNHWVVVYDTGPRGIRVADPAAGPRRLSRAEFEAQWSGYAALFAPTDSFATATAGAEPSFAWLRPMLRPFARPLALAAALALVVSALTLLVPIFTQLIVDRVLGEGDTRLWRVLGPALGGALVLMLAASTAQRYVMSRAAVRMDARTLDLVALRMLALPLSYFTSRRTGDVQRRLAGMRQVREFVVQHSVRAITAVAQLAGSVVLMFVYSPLLGGVYLAAMPVYALVMRGFQRRLRPMVESLEEAFGRYSSRQIDAIKGIETVKALGNEDALRAGMVEEYRGLADRQFRSDLVRMLYAGTSQVVTFASLGAFLWLGTRQVQAGAMTVGELVSFNTLIALASAPVAVLLLLWDDLQFVAVLLNRLNDIFEEEPEQGRDRSRLAPVPTLEGGLDLDNLGFRYGGPDRATHPVGHHAAHPRRHHGGGGRAVRVGQDHADQVPGRPDPADRRPGALRRRGPGHARPPPAPPSGRLRPPGELPLLRHHRPQHLLGRGPRHGAGGVGRPGGQHPRRRLPAATRLRHPGGRERPAPLGRAAPAGGHRPGRVPPAAHPHPRRGHQRPRRRIGAGRPGQHGPAAGGADVAGHRPPALHRPGGRPDRRTRQWPPGGDGHARGAHGPRGPLLLPGQPAAERLRSKRL